MTSDIKRICDHKSIMKGHADPRTYLTIKAIALSQNMELKKEKILKSGNIQYRFEVWDEIK